MSGSCAIVLHTHLPWVAHAGAWPVGEEWLHQAWAASYLPVCSMLERLAGDGFRDVLTLGVTPVLNAMLDDPYLLREFHAWLGNWQVRAWELAARPGEPAGLSAYEHRLAVSTLETFETRWRYGGSPVLRALADSGVVELLGGPATHPFQPLVVDDRLVDFQLAVGLDDHASRLGRRPVGIWAPECGYRPGLESSYAAAGVTHFLVDGPSLHGDTGLGRTVNDSGVVCFGRDLDVTYRVWSPRSGYPGGRWYRDFHTFDHPTGFRVARVTSRRTAPEAKRVYRPEAALAAVRADAEDFVSAVRRRLEDRPLVVVAYDTELFGHWWHEGVTWLEQVIRLLSESGVRLTTLRDAPVGGPVSLGPGSWGSGKDFRVWDGALLDEQQAVQRRLLDVAAKRRVSAARDKALDQLAREALLVMASDWAFCVAKDSAVEYARSRHAAHVARFDRLAALLEAGRPADRLAADLREIDGPFGHLDARTLTALGIPRSR